MIDRTEYPAGVPCWIDLPTNDVDAAVEFYGGLFGWDVVERAPAGAPRYVAAQLDGADVAAIAEAPPSADPQWLTYVCVEDAQATCDVVRSAGGIVLESPAEIPRAGIRALCADPAGARFALWQPAGRVGAERVNVHGSWNFNELRTPDPKGAEAFYGAVFGWVTQHIDFGAGDATMWRRPGYGDFLATLDPTIRERHAEEAFDGFSDAVGWMATAAAGTSAVWDLTFAVDDTDLVVEQAVKLGGQIVSGPETVGPTRVAVLTDPIGARFTVSHYSPG